MYMWYVVIFLMHIFYSSHQNKINYSLFSFKKKKNCYYDMSLKMLSRFNSPISPAKRAYRVPTGTKNKKQNFVQSILLTIHVQGALCLVPCATGQWHIYHLISNSLTKMNRWY